MKKIFLPIIFIVISTAILVFATKGNTGSPLAYQYDKNTSVGGPYEASNNTSRYALVEAIVEHHTFKFTNQEASFSSPDLVKYKDTYFSIFTPGVSFVAVPFYIIGKMFYAPQIFTYISTLIFALLNIFLIRTLAKKLGATEVISWLSGVLFLFATNAFAYALTLTQHHFSTTLILLALLLALGKKSFWKNIALGMIYMAGILVDIPNAFMLLPVLIFVFAQHFQLKEEVKKSVVSFNFSAAGLLIGMIPFLIVFLAYNYSLTGSVSKIGQFIGQYNYPSANSQISQQAIPDLVNDSQPTQAKSNGISIPFKTRLQLQDFYILFLSQQRAWWYYSPIILMGVFGLLLVCLEKSHRTFGLLAASVSFVNVIIYTMFGDPWGGWAFGPRYLLPSAAILAIFIAPLLMKYGKNLLFALAFTALTFYSICISTFGALTTAAIPPYGEAEHQGFRISYTWKYNINLLTKQNNSSSLIYNLYFKQIPAITFAETFVVILCGLFLVTYVFGVLEPQKVVSNLVNKKRKK
ncbi:hypothetical protein BH10PAT2_BH10PAT2_2250 [soil metagenome]